MKISYFMTHIKRSLDPNGENVSAKIRMMKLEVFLVNKQDVWLWMRDMARPHSCSLSLVFSAWVGYYTCLSPPCFHHVEKTGSPLKVGSSSKAVWVDNQPPDAWANRSLSSSRHNCWNNVGLTLVQCRRRWTNVTPALIKRIVSVGHQQIRPELGAFPISLKL